MHWQRCVTPHHQTKKNYVNSLWTPRKSRRAPTTIWWILKRSSHAKWRHRGWIYRSQHYAKAFLSKIVCQFSSRSPLGFPLYYATLCKCDVWQFVALHCSTSNNMMGISWFAYTPSSTTQPQHDHAPHNIKLGKLNETVIHGPRTRTV